MSDLPPADWYTDPNDETQYRYWDGTSWTEHRSPRLATAPASPAPGGLRAPMALIRAALAASLRGWRSCVLAGLLAVVGQVLALVLFMIAVDRVLMGELDEIFDRISATDFDPDAPDQRAYFEALEFDLSALNFTVAALGICVLLLASALLTTTVARVASDYLANRSRGAAASLRRAAVRTPRLVAVGLQVAFVLFVVPGAIIALAALTAPLLLIALIPAYIALVWLSLPIVSIAYVAASVGPRASSLLAAVRLLRHRFWRSTGRLMLLMLLFIAAAIVLALVAGVAAATAQGPVDLAWQIFQGLIGVAMNVVFVAATTVLYHDLGGESD